MPTVRAPDPRLHAIEGRWNTSGHVIADPPVPVVGSDVYDVFPGGHFLVHHVDVTVGEQPVRAVEVIGERDAATGAYLARSFDGDGNVDLMQLTIDDSGAFRFVGGGDIASAAQPADKPTARVRSTLTAADDGQSMHALWERSEDGSTWQPWMEIRFTRA